MRILSTTVQKMVMAMTMARKKQSHWLHFRAIEDSACLDDSKS